ncbi:hypothetical protein FFI94_000295 [Rhodococcus sp. KBS0724]|uniref:hypothetical protein n=1 Tax=Rhodococcus sp. KBS0724 TaxID=1179674 RepID=UPI001184BB0F|nr:hypothetical protein [Rhodococcus sp. KBS0724]TSD44754.1 hypothetical protein FFI94_000295 [Rhodococcus sp. KBS0724]
MDDGDPRWSIYMMVAIPEYATVRDEILRLCRSPRGNIDEDRLLQAIASAAWEMLRELTIGREDIAWTELRQLGSSPNFDHAKLAAYLSTAGAVGIAVNDKLRNYLTHTIPQELSASVDSGKFNRTWNSRA